MAHDNISIILNDIFIWSFDSVEDMKAYLRVLVTADGLLFWNIDKHSDVEFDGTLPDHNDTISATLTHSNSGELNKFEV